MRMTTYTKMLAQTSHTNDPELRHLICISPVRSSLYLTLDVSLLVAILAAVALFPHPLVVLLSIPLIGRQQNALFSLAHDAVHGRLFRSRRLNQFVGRCCFGGTVFISYDGFRSVHLKHHSSTMQSDDPDRQFVEGFPMKKRALLRQFVNDFLGLSWLFVFFFYLRYGYKALGSWRALVLSYLPGITIQLTVMAVLLALDLEWMILFCWLIPAVVMVPFYLHVRGITEHAGLRVTDDQLMCTRTVTSSWQTFFIAPHNACYHIEHHANPAVPHFNLKTLHFRLRDQDGFPMQNVHSSYRTAMQEITTPS